MIAENETDDILPADLDPKSFENTVGKAYDMGLLNDHQYDLLLRDAADD